MTNVQTIDEAIQIMQNFFFPPTNFFLYKDQMSALHSNNYNTVSDYFINLRKLQKVANLTISSEEALLECEILQIFLNGLPFHLQQMAASQGTLQLEELATKLDNAVFISNNLKHKSINNFKNYRNKNFVKKWCDLHKTNSHSNHECYKQNQRKQNNFERENKKLEERLFCPRVKILLKSSQEPVKALLDSGSSRTLINPKHIKILNKEPLEKPIMFNCSNNQKTSCYEKSLLKFSFPEGDRNSFFSHEIILSQYIPDTMIIGLDFMKKVEGNIMFGKDTFDIHDISIPLILDNSINKKENFQNNDKKILSTKNIDIKDIKSLIEHTKSVSSKYIGVFPNYEHKIELFSDVNTLNKRIKPFRFCSEDISEINKQLDYMLKEDIITPSTSNICSAAFLVGKKNGKKRLVVDYTATNKISKPDHYPLPIVSTILNQLQEREIFSKLDLTSGYFHVKLHPDTIPISSFVVLQGVYAFKRQPFGLSSGPQAFQRSMDSIFGDDKDVFLYLDDILIASKNYSDHYESLKKSLVESS